MKLFGSVSFSRAIDFFVPEKIWNPAKRAAKTVKAGTAQTSLLDGFTSFDFSAHPEYAFAKDFAQKTQEILKSSRRQ